MFLNEMVHCVMLEVLLLSEGKLFFPKVCFGMASEVLCYGYVTYQRYFVGLYNMAFNGLRISVIVRTVLPCSLVILSPLN